MYVCVVQTICYSHVLHTCSPNVKTFSAHVDNRKPRCSPSPHSSTQYACHKDHMIFPCKRCILCPKYSTKMDVFPPRTRKTLKLLTNAHTVRSRLTLKREERHFRNESTYRELKSTNDTQRHSKETKNTQKYKLKTNTNSLVHSYTDEPPMNHWSLSSCRYRQETGNFISQ